MPSLIGNQDIQPLTEQILQIVTTHPVRKGSFLYLGFFLCIGSIGSFLYVHFTEHGLSGQQNGWVATFSPLMTLLFATPHLHNHGQSVNKYFDVRLIANLG